MKKDPTIEEEINNAFRERSLSFYEDRIEITEDFNHADELISIMKLVHEFVQSNGDLFTLEGEVGRHCIALNGPYEWIVRILKDYFENPYIVEYIASRFPMHVLHPYIELFMRKFKDISVENIDIHLNYAQLTKMMNQLIESIRREVDSKPFKKIINNYQRLQTKNYKSVVDYLDNLSTHYSRFFVVRTDLSYKKKMYGHIFNEDQHKEMYFQVKSDRELLFKSMRTNPQFKHLVGYVWKLEYGLEKGFHLNLLLIFDGSKPQKNVKIAKLIGSSRFRGVATTCSI